MRKKVYLIIASLIILSLLSSCTILEKLGLQKNNDETYPVSSITISADEAKKLSDKVPVHLYFANQENNRLRLEVRYIPMSEAKKSVNNLASTIVNELIKGPGSDSGLLATIPSGTKLRTPVSLNAAVATVDFSKEFVEKHPGGKAAAQMTIYSIVNSLTELKEIEKVKFTIDGKVQKDFKQSFQFDAPFPRTMSLVAKSPASNIGDPGTNPKATTTKSTETTKKTNDKTKSTTPPAKTDSQKGSNTKSDSGNGSDLTVNQDLTGNQELTEAVDGSEGTYIDILE